MVWKETVVDYWKVLSQHSRGVSEEIYGKCMMTRTYTRESNPILSEYGSAVPLLCEHGRFYSVYK
jgi:hypothetical protein